jgi:hypothetical protein
MQRPCSCSFFFRGHVDLREIGQGWQGKTETLRLVGWSRQRRVVVLRRPGGRKKKALEDPTLLADLKRLVEPATRGVIMKLKLLWPGT